MKTIIASIMCLLLMASCSKKEDNATVIKDCTGSYIRQNDKDYFICNEEVTSTFETGTKVYVEYNKVNKCDQLNDAICLMLHLSEGTIEITKIK